MSILRRKTGDAIDAQNPMHVDDVSVAMDKESVSSETITFITGAIGFTGVVTTDKKPIANLDGDWVGSHWRSPGNIVGETGRDRSTVASINSLTIVITSPNLNLEEVYETPSATLEYIIEVVNTSGESVYGWINTVATSGDQYTFDIYDSAAASTNAWVGGLGGFDTSNSGLIIT